MLYHYLLLKSNVAVTVHCLERSIQFNIPRKTECHIKNTDTIKPRSRFVMYNNTDIRYDRENV